MAVSDGHVSIEANVAAAISHDATLAQEIKQEEEHLHDIPEIEQAKGADDKSTGKLVVEEEVEIGRITWNTFATYLRAAAGKKLPLFLAVWIAALGLENVINVGSTWFLGYWASQYQNHDPSEVNVSR